jgi:hypothetical protein
MPGADKDAGDGMVVLMLLGLSAMF